MGLTRTQISRLLTPVREDRIEKKQGLTYLPQHEARAEMIRIFGPGNWDSRVYDVTLLYEEREERGEKVYWRVCYRAACEVNIRDYEGNHIASFTEYHAEENAPQPNRGEAHALSLTSVESYALRRALIGLGDAFGLHLYNGGSTAPLVKGSLVLTDPESPLYVAPKEPAEKPAAAAPPDGTADPVAANEEAAAALRGGFGGTPPSE